MSENTRPCEVCGQPIEAERLEVVPETRLCIAHARQIEKEYGKEFIVTGKLDRTSKEGSLKKNYGGVTPSLRRNVKAVRKLREEYQREQERKQQ
jgi:hypothetical protein